MRKWFITLISLLLAFTACRQEDPVLTNDGNKVDLSILRFNISIQHPEATKGVKSDWEAGDKVFIFISGCTTGYLTTSSDGTVWTEEYVGAPIFGVSGYIQAVYLPYGNTAHPTYIENENKWTFDEGTDTYYFYASNVPYTVETIGSAQVFSASIQMVKPQTYVQFYIPYSSASGTIQFACNALCPAVIAGISASDGTVTVNTGLAGTPVTGYADTLAGEEGYYVSGIPVTTTSETADYYFAIKKGDDYSHYYKNRNALVANHAYQLPAYSAWPRVGDSRHVMVANGNWKTVNEGASHPWDLGELKDNSFVISTGEGLPNATDWNNLMDNGKAIWMPMDIWGSHGSLVRSVSSPNKYVYIPWNDSATNYYWMADLTDFDNAFQIAADGALTVPNPASIPGSAYVRTLERLSCFRVRAKFDDTEMTFKYTYANGGIQYLSPDLGVTEWTQYDGSKLYLSENDVVYFKGTRTDCNCSGTTQLFNANKVCYIAGDITSLLANQNALSSNAFRSAFSKANNETNLSSTVDWVDIDPDDPLILPAFTSSNCYYEMFRGCTSLTWAPDLPATTLAEQCYFRMFHSCTGISSIPSFPSEQVTWAAGKQRYCYQMFQSCTGITALTEPLFGGTLTMGKGCFEDMFAHCTGLTSVIPGLLPATTLAENCYRGMFQDTRFGRAPELLAGTLVKECYRYMFNGCTQLTYIKCLATTNIGNGYTTNWVGGSVPNNANCTFIKASTATSWPSGANGILNKWIVEDYSE